MVNFIRQTEILKGNGLKKVEFCEKKNIKIARKSLVSNSIIKKNELFNLKNLEVKRPGTGIPANEYFNYLGKKAKRDFLIDELIK
jgi:sialic acid synthase SpsE